MSDGTKTIPRRRVERSEDRREAILDAATRLFAETGFSDADTQVVAERLGIGKGTVYRHFPSKRELFLAAADRAMSRLHERMELRIALIPDPLQKIAVAVRVYLEFFDDHPEYVELLIQERALFRDRTTPTYFEHRDRHAGYWRELYAGLVASGRFRAWPVDRMRDVMSQVLYGTMFTNYFRGRSQSSADQAREILEVVFLGMLSDPERARFQEVAAIPWANEPIDHPTTDHPVPPMDPKSPPCQA